MLHLTYLIHVALGEVSSHIHHQNSNQYVTKASTCVQGIDKQNTNSSQYNDNENLKDIYITMFNQNGDIDAEQIENSLNMYRDISSMALCKTKDVDHYNILEKSVLYDCVKSAEIILCKIKSKGAICDADIIKDSVHLAAYLGLTHFVELFSKFNPNSLKLKGCVRIQAVAGSSKHKLSDHVSVAHTGSTSENKSRHYWITKHPGELPVYYAVCGNHCDMLQHIIHYNSDNYDNKYIQHLIQAACFCASFECLPVLLDLLPDGANTRGPRGHLIISRGLGQGPPLFQVLSRCDFDPVNWNNIDGQGTNALHYFYANLSQNDRVYNKYRYVKEVTLLLVESGTSVNAVTSTYTGHAHPETPLHLLLDNINLIIANDPSDFIKASTRSKLQRQYDRGLVQSVNVILENGFDLNTHAKSITLKLFQNRHVWMRYQMKEKICDIDHHEFGLRNIYLAVSRLLKQGVHMQYHRREMSPLIAVIDGLKSHPGSCDILEGDTGRLYVSCLRILLANGVSPNSYPLKPDETAVKYAIPLVHLLDMFSQQWRNSDGDMTRAVIFRLTDIIELFCEYHSVFLCSRYTFGRYVKHGVFDSIMTLLEPVFDGASVEYSGRTLAVVRKVTLPLLQWGADAVVYQNVEVLSRHGLPENHAFRESLLTQWFNLATYLRRYNICAHPDYQKTLVILLNQANHQNYHGCLSQNAAISILQGAHQFYKDLKEFSRLPRSLRNLCRQALYSKLQKMYKKRVRRLPIPPLIQQYLISFDIE